MMRPSEAEWTADALYYVKPDGSGDGKGSSWTNAMSGTAFSAKLKEINAAKDGKAYEFRVAKGIYEQSETLRLPKGVKLPLLGDLVLCSPVIAREAREPGKPLRAHYAHLTVHGALHLLGWDHEDAREAEAMEQLERQILAGIGLPDPYRES